MITAVGGTVKLEGRRIDLQAEFMSIVQSFVKNEVFVDNNALMEAVQFAMLDDEKLKQLNEEMVTALQKKIADKVVQDLMEKMRDKKDT